MYLPGVEQPAHWVWTVLPLELGLSHPEHGQQFGFSLWVGWSNYLIAVLFMK